VASGPGYWTDLARRGLRRSPRAIAIRLLSELKAETERIRGPVRARRFGERALLDETGINSLDRLWRTLAERPYLAQIPPRPRELARWCPNEEELILERGQRAVEHQVDLLGSGLIRLGAKVDWHCDAKSGVSWPLGYSRRLRLSNPSDASDVKFPWELSRLQWLLPAGQAYLLTGEQRYARAARLVLEDWIAGNPYAYGVNWAIAMEPALRIFSWTWLFHVFNTSPEWTEPGFRARFLSALYLHGEYVDRNLERSDVNGNHLTANAAGLVVAGAFFGVGRGPQRWARVGWDILASEIDQQIHPDGVDYEGSTAYHRLVMELFFFPALYRERLGYETHAPYRKKIEDMARFVVSYSRPDGLAPSWGDADDGRALPLGTQALNDHRYLIGLVGAHWKVSDLCEMASGPLGEAFWILGEASAHRLAESDGRTKAVSAAFPTAGVYVMRTDTDHVFVDAGPVGMKGRGGHGHNDCLSFDATLHGVLLVVDPGSYVYTASYEWRNRFRGTAAHNTPVIEGAEQNRFLHPHYLWSLRDDASPTVLAWEPGSHVDSLCASHSGYARDPIRVTPRRTIRLDRQRHRLSVRDEFEGRGHHQVRIGLQLARGIQATRAGEYAVRLDADDKSFTLNWSSTQPWSVDVADSWISPSYGVKVAAPRLEFTREGSLAELLMVIAPATDKSDDVLRWANSDTPRGSGLRISP
jgi:uncharacterized heparinase superfamily protein